MPGQHQGVRRLLGLMQTTDIAKRLHTSVGTNLADPAAAGPII